MDFKDFTAGKDDDGRRFDRILRIFLSDKSLTEIYKLVRKGLVKLNHKKAKPENHVASGDIISIAAFLLNPSENQNENSPAPRPSNHNQKPQLKIVFENQNLLIIDKPYGRNVHGNENQEKNIIPLDKEVLNYYLAKKKQNDSLSFRPGPLHRLDKNTTGLLVFSMSIEGARWFSEGIKNHTIHKKYFGLAEGSLSQKEVWQDKLTDSEKTTDEGFFTVKEADDGLAAETEVTPLAEGIYKGQKVTLIEYAIKTGRKHQIRAQSAIHGHPLLGDSAYGSKNKCKGKREFYLQAFELEFPKANPLELPQKIKIRLSPDFSDILEYCEIKNPGL